MLAGTTFSSVDALAQNTRPAEYSAADADLNATYRLLALQLTPADAQALRKAQRAWIAFRDADCVFGWAETFDCLIARTSERELQLRNSVYFDRKGKYIKLPAP